MQDGVLVRRFPTLRNDEVFFLSPQLGWWLMRNASRFALLHAHSYHTPLAFQASLASMQSSTPFVVTPHYHGTGHSPFRRALHAPYRLGGGWLLRRARQVICVSNAEREMLHHHFGPSLATSVVPNGVEIDLLRTPKVGARRPDRQLVLAVGRLERYKQTERLVAAAPFLPPTYEVVVVGEGPARADLERVALETGGQGRLRLLGRVSHDELADLYGGAAVFVSLSQHESFGLTLLEAAVAGARIVASDIPAHREVAGYLPAGSVTFVDLACTPAELAQSVQRAAAAPLPAGERNWSLPTWDDAVEGALACYRAALDGHQLAKPA